MQDPSYECLLCKGAAFWDTPSSKSSCQGEGEGDWLQNAFQCPRFFFSLVSSSNTFLWSYPLLRMMNLRETAVEVRTQTTLESHHQTVPASEQRLQRQIPRFCWVLLRPRVIYDEADLGPAELLGIKVIRCDRRNMIFPCKMAHKKQRIHCDQLVRFVAGGVRATRRDFKLRTLTIFRGWDSWDKWQSLWCFQGPREVLSYLVHSLPHPRQDQSETVAFDFWVWQDGKAEIQRFPADS